MLAHDAPLLEEVSVERRGYPCTVRAASPKKEIEYPVILVMVSRRELLNDPTPAREYGRYAPLMLDLVNGPYDCDEGLRRMINNRGLGGR